MRRRARRARRALRAALALALAASCGRGPRSDWRVTGGDAGNTRYSPLDQITTGNVATLRVAWTYHTGVPGEIQATPIVVDSVLYATTPQLALIALRADSGTLLWKFDPFAGRDSARASHVNRGVVYWQGEHALDRRIFYGAGRRLYAVDARTGQPVPSFGDSGSIDLAAGLSRDVGNAYVVATSPGVVYQDLLIQGIRVGESEGSAPGDVRAYDVRTGALRWVFHTIPHAGEPGSETWPAGAWQSAGGANSWAGMSVDSARGIVYVPTGSATPDFYGGARTGANLYANSLLALDARTGKRLWHFQTVHHDIWDRDLPAAPNLVTVDHAGARVDAVAQIAKSGFVFLFDRRTGQPLFPIEERAVPASDLAGEHAWPTQPFPTRPAPFARQSMSESDVADITRGAHAVSLARYRTFKPDALFTPPSVEGSVVLPGFDGGGEWGGAAVDPDGVLYVNASDVPWIAAMRPSVQISPAVTSSGASVYEANCASCHGADRRGRDRAPSLLGVATRLAVRQTDAVLKYGRGFMPSFDRLPGAQKRALLAYLGYSRLSVDSAPGGPATSVAAPSPYEFAGYERWRDSAGLPAIKPPWGTLSAIDLNTGEYRWHIPLGQHPKFAGRSGPPTGTEQYGGPIVTAGGVLFIAATMDAKFRAFDAHTGKLLWETTLPAAGYATPSTYAVHGRQYVVIAAGGTKLGSPSGDSYVAFALP